MFLPSLRSSVSLLRSTSRASLPLTRAALPPSAISLAAARLLSTEARAQIEGAIKGSPVVLFMKGTPAEPQCGFSRAVVQVLDLHGVPDEKIKAYNVLADAELRTGIKEFSEWPTIPQVYINGEFLGGCDILLGMHQSGELETLLVKNNIIPEEIPEAAPAPTAA